MTKTKVIGEAKPKRPYNRKPKVVDAVGGGNSAPEGPDGQGATKSLLTGLVHRLHPVAANVVVLDFAGQEELLARAQAASDDLQRDIIALLQALLDGKLFTNDGSVLEV